MARCWRLRRGRGGKTNLYVLRIAGGESEQLTDVKSGAWEISRGRPMGLASHLS